MADGGDNMHNERIKGVRGWGEDGERLEEHLQTSHIHFNFFTFFFFF